MHILMRLNGCIYCCQLGFLKWYFNSYISIDGDNSIECDYSIDVDNSIENNNS